jgi:hypothetical protein
MSKRALHRHRRANSVASSLAPAPASPANRLKPLTKRCRSNGNLVFLGWLEDSNRTNRPERDGQVATFVGPSALFRKLLTWTAFVHVPLQQWGRMKRKQLQILACPGIDE